MNRLSVAKRIQVVSARVEGNSLNAIVRMTGVAKHTLLKLLEDMGRAHVGKLGRMRACRVPGVCGFETFKAALADPRPGRYLLPLARPWAQKRVLRVPIKRLAQFLARAWVGTGLED
jgi:hypothetical protein